MKILMLVNRFYPDIGGVEKHVLNLSKELLNNGDEVKIISLCEDRYPVKEVYEKIEIYRIYKIGLKRLNYFFWFLKNIKLILTSEIIHCHDFSTFWIMYLPFRFLLFWKNVYVTFHGWEGDIPPKKNVIQIRKIVEKLTKGNICIGHYIEKWYGTKANIISYGATYEYKKKSEIIENTFVYIGRLEKDTGIEMYLRVLKILKNKYNIDLHLTICGNGSLIDSLKKYGEKEDLKLEFLGFVNNPEEYIEKSEICFTSGYLGILEAMIQKKIVISNYNNELKKDYLLMIPDVEDKMIVSNDEEELSEKVFSLLKNEKLKQDLKDNAYNWAKELSWKRMREDYYKLWKK